MFPSILSQCQLCLRQHLPLLSAHPTKAFCSPLLFYQKLSLYFNSPGERENKESWRAALVKMTAVFKGMEGGEGEKKEWWKVVVKGTRVEEEY